MSQKHKLREALTEAHGRMSYNNISEHVFKGHVSGATIWKIVTRNKWPKSPKLRRLLCINPEQKLSDLAPSELLRRLENRRDYAQ